MNGLLAATSPQKILNFLIAEPGHEYLAAEIQKATGISKGGVNLSLRELARKGLARREKRGKIFFYSVDPANPICKQLKVVSTLELIMPLVRRVSGDADRVILFGSAARGEDNRQSDIDVLIIAHHSKDEIERIARQIKLPKKLQLIVRDPVSFAAMEKNDPVFFEEVSRGLTVWERKG
jgi:predicted nucleotidyltransferase